MVIIADFIGRSLVKLPTSPILTGILFVVVVLEAGILVKATGRIPGAVIFGFVATFLSLLIGVITTDILTIAITMVYWTAIGYAVAWFTPIAARTVGVGRTG
jgi:hypothetical protein